jgi:hypothetical protein
MSINVRRVEAVVLNGAELRAGDRVRIRINDLQRGISGKIAVIEAFEHDATSRTQVVVRLEERSRGFDQSAVRLLLTLDEIEVLV